MPRHVSATLRRSWPCDSCPVFSLVCFAWIRLAFPRLLDACNPSEGSCLRLMRRPGSLAPGTTQALALAKARAPAPPPLARANTHGRDHACEARRAARLQGPEQEMRGRRAARLQLGAGCSGRLCRSVERKHLAAPSAPDGLARALAAASAAVGTRKCYPPSSGAATLARRRRPRRGRARAWPRSRPRLPRSASSSRELQR